MESSPGKKNLRSCLAICLVLLAINILMWPADMCPGDTYAWMLEGNAILNRGSLTIQADIPQELLSEAGKFFVVNETNHRLYSKYGVGSSIAILPALWASRQLPGPQMRSLLLCFNVEYAIVAALLGVLFYHLARRAGAGALTAWVFVLAVCYGTFAWQYLRAQTMDVFLCLYFSAWFLLVRKWQDHVRRDAGERPGIVIAIWLMVLMLSMTRAIFVMMVPITIWALGREIFTGRVPARAMRFALGSIVPALGIALVLGSVNHMKFGAWYYTGYHQWSVDNSPSSANLINLYELVTDPHFSIFLSFPVFAISLFGARRFWNSHREDYLLAIVPAVLIGSIYLLTYNWRGEWAEGPRYFLFALPAVSLPFVVVIDQLLAKPSEARARLCLVFIAACLLWTGAMQYLTLCRPFFAYNFRLTGPVGMSDRRFAKLTTIWPRGYTMDRVWRAVRDGRSDPFLEGAKETLRKDYDRYEQELRTGLAPNNLWWFGSR